MRWLIGLFGVIVSALPGVAIAAPVYLKCSIQQAGGPLEVNFVLDEETRHVAVIIPKTGAVDQARGVFSSDRVLIPRDPSSFEINRIDLSVVRATPMIKTVDRGKCKVEPLPKRAF